MDRDISGQTADSAKTTGNLQSDLELEPEFIVWVYPNTSLRPTKLGSRTLSLGRGSDCDVCLPGTETSRRHAEISRLGPIFTLRDCGSHNGVFLNGSRIKEGPLSVGSVVRLGEWLGIVASGRRAHDPADFREFAPGLLGGPLFKPVADLAQQTARTHLPIILEGETGTGKELLARAIHSWSGRSGSFCAVNCAALPDSLAEAELFGYRKGAFTGAERNSLGYFRATAGGTLLLDEILEMPLALQAKVLRVLDRREVVPLGETQPTSIDVRIIAAAQSPLQGAVAQRTFRSDLLARLDGVRIRLPALRERREEIPWLFQQLLAQHSGGRVPHTDIRLIEQLCIHDWPFNLREIDLLVRRLLALHGHEPLLKRAHLPSHLRSGEERRERRGERSTRAETPLEVIVRTSTAAQVDRDSRDLQGLISALRAHRGNVAQAAAAIGISRQRAYRLMGAATDVRLENLRSEPPSANADSKQADAHAIALSPNDEAV